MGFWNRITQPPTNSEEAKTTAQNRWATQIANEDKAIDKAKENYDSGNAETAKAQDIDAQLADKATFRPNQLLDYEDRKSTRLNSSH